MRLLQLKNEYNSVLPRMNKAMVYMDNPEVSDTEKDKYVPAFKTIERKLDGLIADIKQAGYVMTPDDIINGFREVLL